MLTLTLENCKDKVWEEVITVVPNKRMKDGKYYKTLVPIKVRLSTGDTICIHKDFYFDGSSRPKFLGFILDKVGPFMLAALIHDWMYVKDYRRVELGLKKAQKLADDEMYVWSKVLYYDTPWARLDTDIRYYGVRAFGKRVYARLETD